MQELQQEVRTGRGSSQSRQTTAHRQSALIEHLSFDMGLACQLPNNSGAYLHLGAQSPSRKSDQIDWSGYNCQTQNGLWEKQILGDYIKLECLNT